MSARVLDKVFYELLDRVSGIQAKNAGDAFLAKAKGLYGLSNVAYLGVNIPHATHGDHYVQCTYSDAWVRHYVSEGFVSIDPVVRLGLTSLVPLDWQELDTKSSPEVQRFFGDARAFGVGRHGLTFPVRGMRGKTAIFSINADVGDREWEHLKRHALRDFHVLAQYFHSKVLVLNGHVAKPKLSRKQLACLRWAAAGKSTWDIAHIENLTERAVKFHLDTARHELDCLTRGQAVAKAIALGILLQ